MPKIRRQNLPPALLNHLLDPITEREISFSQLGLFADWLVTEPEVPEGRGSNDFRKWLCAERARSLKHSCGRAGSYRRRSALVRVERARGGEGASQTRCG
jgi:hypothetical protein